MAEKDIIDEKFSKIERKLKNSFRAIKEDINFLKLHIEEPHKSLKDSQDFIRLKEEFNSLKETLDERLNEVKESLEGFSKKTDEGDLKKILNEFANIRKEIVTKTELATLKSRLNETLNNFDEKIERTKNEIAVSRKTKSLEESSLRELLNEISQLRQDIVTKIEINELRGRINKTLTFFHDEIEKLKEGYNEKSKLKEELITEISSKIEESVSDIEKKFSEKSSAIEKEINELKEELTSSKKEIKEKNEEIGFLQKQIKTIRNKVSAIKEETPEQFEELEKKEKTSKKIFITIIFLIPIAILIYFLITNINIFNLNLGFSEKKYFFDIGSEEDEEFPLLYPNIGVSEVKKEGDITYREILSDRIYFDIPAGKRDKKINIEIRIKNNFPDFGGALGVGVKKRDTLDYEYVFLIDPPQLRDLKKDEWVIRSAQFEAKDLLLNNQSYSFVIIIPHLELEEQKDHPIPIDYINISIS